MKLSYVAAELDDMLSDSSATDDETEKNKILVPFDECVNYIQVYIIQKPERK